MSDPESIPAAPLLHVYWSVVSLVLGACIGSFLNVVIYRWPRGLSIRQPSRSFCPTCQSQLRWFDNVPVVSYLVLRARCRTCGQPISLQYPLVEMATALVFLITYDAFFVARQRLGIGQLGVDWPMLLAHWALWAGMIAVAVMDLEEYMVDIRVTWLVALAGLVGHAIWTPDSSRTWIRPGPVAAGMSAAALLGLAISTAWLLLRRPADVPAPAAPEPSADPTTASSAPASSAPAPSPAPPAAPAPCRAWSAWLLVPLLLIGLYLVALALAGEQAPFAPKRPGADPTRLEVPMPASGPDAGTLRLGIGFTLVFIALTLAASQPRAQADVDIVEAIHAEAIHARSQALWELRFLAPALVLGIGTVMLLNRSPAACEHLLEALRWDLIGSWRPLLGLATGLAGWIIGGAIGWICRIVFTLLFGKEALGMGDVHILAAAGAVAGWPVAFLGFFLAAPLTLLAVLVIQLRRQSRALPYGPWLALAFLLCCVFQDRILDYLGIRTLLAAAVF